MQNTEFISFLFTPATFHSDNSRDNVFRVLKTKAPAGD